MADQVLTLVEAAKSEPASQATGYIGIYASAYQTNYVAPVQKSDRVYTWQIEDDLPYTGSTGSRAIDADFDATQANFKNYEAVVKAYGGKIKSDEYIVDNMADSIARQEKAQVEAFARKAFIDTFEGSGGSDMRGIRDWLGGNLTTHTGVTAAGYENQIVEAGSTGGGDLITLDMLDDAIDYVNLVPGKTFIYCNKIITRRIKKLSRGTVTDGSQYNAVYNPAEIGKFDGLYNGIPIVTTTDGKTANLLSTTEFDAAASQTTLSLYIVTWDVDQATYFSTNPAGIAGVPMPMVVDANDGSNYQYKRFKFYLGFVPQQPRSVVRLRGLKNAVA